MKKILRSSHFEVDKSFSNCYGKVDEWTQEPKTGRTAQAIADRCRRSRGAASADRGAQNRGRRLGATWRVSGFITEAGPHIGIRPRQDEKTDASVVWETDRERQPEEASFRFATTRGGRQNRSIGRKR